MDSNLLAAVVPALFSFFATLIGILMTNKVTIYRISELEKKVDKHNTIVERMYKAESDIKTVFLKLDTLRDEQAELKNEIKDKADKKTE